MERKLTLALAGLSLVLAVTLVATLAIFVAPSVVNAAFGQAGGAPGLFQMPCASRQAGQAGSASNATGITLTGNVVKDAEAAALAFYRQKYGDANVTVKATDYGCHVQADVYKNGKVVRSLSYDGAGGVFELN